MSLLLLFQTVALAPTDPFAGSDFPVIGTHNIVTIANLTTDTEDADFPATNLANEITSLRWQAADTTEQYITISCSGEGEIDYLGIVKHNFHSAGIAVSLEGDDGGGFVELLAPFIPDDDGPLIFRSAAQELETLRLKLATGTAAARGGVVYVGKLLELPRKIWQGHNSIKDGKNTSETSAASISGDFLGSVVLGETNETTIPFKLINPDFYREFLRPFVFERPRRPFFFAWRPLTYPQECGYLWIKPGSNPKPTPVSPHGLIEFSLSVNGVT